MQQQSPTLPEVLAENPDLVPAVRAAINDIDAKAKSAPAEKRPDIKHAADYLRQAVAKSRLITVKGGATNA